MTQPDDEAGIQLVLDADWSKIHVPRPEHPIEGLLAAANERGRNGAIELLSRLLPGLPFSELAQTTDCGTLLVGQVPTELGDLLDPLRTLDAIFSWRGLQGQQIALVRELNEAPQSSYLAPLGLGGRPRLSAARVAALMKDGYTVVLNGIELRDPISMRVTEAFERVFGCAVNINGYLSLRPSMSFGRHWDDQETVIVQLLGRKTWAVEEPVALSMEKAVHGSVTSERPVWEGSLTPGSFLYVPRGWGHQVRSVDELTYHYTITIPRPNGARILSNILARRLDTGGRLVSAPSTPQAGKLEDLAPPITASDLEAAIGIVRLDIASRSTQRLSTALAVLSGQVDGLWVRSTAAGGWIVQDHDRSHAIVGVAGRQFQIELRLLPLVADWADGLTRPWPTGSPDQDRVVTRLVRLGVLDVMSGPPGWGNPVALGSL